MAVLIRRHFLVSALRKKSALPIFLKYYLDVTVYNLLLSFVVGLYGGVFYSLITFGVFGTLLGFLVYEYFKKREYYFYFNYGYTKKMLIARVWGINLLLMIIVGLICLLIANFL